MSKNTIKIDGDKLKALLEYYTKKSLYEISEDEGFSRNFLPQACRAGKASPIVQAVARNYGVEPEQYKLKEKDLKQMTIEEIATYNLDNEKVYKILRDAAEAIEKALNKCTESIVESLLSASNILNGNGKGDIEK